MAAEAEFMALECGDDQLAEKIRAAAARAKLFVFFFFKKKEQYPINIMFGVDL